MDELRLVGVHDDGEHLVLQGAAGARHLLRIDQQLRGTVQRAHRVAVRRPSNQSGNFGPRDIQARFRAGATIEEIVEESGWEASRVKRYEWPILAERAHIAREAQKVEVIARTSRTGGYRSVFDGEPQSLAQTVATHAPDLGVATTSLDWDAWQRPDQQWQVSARFRVSNPQVAPRDLVDQQPVALWLFNPASLTVSPDNGWASHLTAIPEQDRGPGGSDSLFGLSTQAAGEARAADTPAPEKPSEPAQTATAQPEGSEPAVVTGREPAPDPEDSAQETDQLLDVLEARRGQRLGQDTDSDDHLAEILGRNMGHVQRHPRPISAPQDSTLFDRQVTESAGSVATQGSEHPARGRATSPGQSQPNSTTREATHSPEPVAESQQHSGATIHQLGRADVDEQPSSPVVEITDDESRPLTEDHASSASSASSDQGAKSAATADASGSEETEAEQLESGAAVHPPEDAQPETSATVTLLRGGSRSAPDTAPQTAADQEASSEPAGNSEQAARPRPRGRTGAKRSRSSVPSWDEIVFGAKNDES